MYLMQTLNGKIFIGGKTTAIVFMCSYNFYQTLNWMHSSVAIIYELNMLCQDYFRKLFTIISLISLYRPRYNYVLL